LNNFSLSNKLAPVLSRSFLTCLRSLVSN